VDACFSGTWVEYLDYIKTKKDELYIRYDNNIYCVSQILDTHKGGILIQATCDSNSTVEGLSFVQKYIRDDKFLSRLWNWKCYGMGKIIIWLDLEEEKKIYYRSL